ncbi:MAG: site-2 protease family protein [Isosphaeraceae bacterium]
MGSLIDFANILKVALGLGLVIFLHELGHFLLAKWNGVKVEKFSIGFGPTILGFRKGETEYVLAAVPLGGFVKMLGEGPEEEANKSNDPRAYPNKSVGARMAIISAGVIMNLILGLACFVYAYGQGMDERPPVIGSVVAGAPAFEAGFRPGDEIVSLDGRRDLSFDNVRLRSHLSTAGQVLHFEVKRPGEPNLIPIAIEPKREANQEVPGIGISPRSSLVVYSYTAPAGFGDAGVAPGSALKAKDEVVAIGTEGKEPVPVTDAEQWNRVVSQYRDRPLTVVVERKEGEAKTATRQTVTLPPNHFVDFGFRLKIEPIKAIRGGSIAEKAGFRVGDTIVKVDGLADFDPMRLPTLCYENAGKEMTFEVSRPEPGGSPRTVEIKVKPDDTPPWTEIAFPNEPLEISGLGLAYPVRTKIEGVREGSPAAKAGLKVGEVITKMAVPILEPAEAAAGGSGWFSKKGPKSADWTFDEKSLGWATAFQSLQFRPRGSIDLFVNNSNKPVTITPEPVADWFHPARGEQFEVLIRKMPPQPVEAALRRGFDDTVDNILSIYAMFRSLAQRRVSPKNLGGPIMIAQVAYSAAGSSLTDLIHFLGILSINLAVLNFMPIPPLDGGQMVFLLAEKVRGRPLPESALIAGTYLGLFLVLGLMAFVMYQDVGRLF